MALRGSCDEKCEDFEDKLITSLGRSFVSRKWLWR